MIVAKAPLRLGFVGGGLDSPEIFDEEPLFLLGTAINKYVYVSVNHLSRFADEWVRFTYRKTESCAAVSELEHPVVRAVLEWRARDLRLNIATMADLPGHSGLGSSSAFTVALLSAVSAIRGHEPTPVSLWRDALHVERELLGERGGWQDQVQSTFGGFRLYSFFRGNVSSRPLQLSGSRLRYLSEALRLRAVGTARQSFHGGMLRATLERRRAALREVSALAAETASTLENATEDSEALDALAQAVATGWSWKRSLISGDLDKAVLDAEEEVPEGLLARKLCGNGVRGFFLEIARPEAWNGVSDQGCEPVTVGAAGVSVSEI